MTDTAAHKARETQDDDTWPNPLVLECEWCDRSIEIDPHRDSAKDDNGPWCPLTEEARDRRDGGGHICSYCADAYHRGYREARDD